jgi:hypothetical protein
MWFHRPVSKKSKGAPEILTFRDADKRLEGAPSAVFQGDHDEIKKIQKAFPNANIDVGSPD